MEDDILNDTHKMREIAIINKNPKDGTSIGNLNGEFELFDEKVNNKIEAAGECIKNGIHDEFK